MITVSPATFTTTNKISEASHFVKAVKTPDLTPSVTPGASAQSRNAQPHPLRVLAVDDNALNLSVLTRLLRTRFSHMLDGAPVAVDSALKALQLLRENVFDVIFMDIQMPFMSGVDATEHIRAGADGILPANQHVTIIGVTTATGPEPEAVYRRAGLDGIIGKPVKVAMMQEFLTPFYAVAQEVSRQIPTFDLEGEQVLPAVPVVPLSGERIFYVPSAHLHRNSPLAPSITLSQNFEDLLKQQTWASLHRFGACALSRTFTTTGLSDRRRLRQYDAEHGQDASNELPAQYLAPLTIGASPTVPNGDDVLSSPTSTDSDRPSHRRQSSMTFSQNRLRQQLQQQMDAAHVNGVGLSTSADLPRVRPQPRRYPGSCHFYGLSDEEVDESQQIDHLVDGLKAYQLSRCGSVDTPEDDKSDANSRPRAASPKSKAGVTQRPALRPHQRPSPAGQASYSGSSLNSSSEGSRSGTSSGYDQSTSDFRWDDRSRSSITETDAEYDSPLTSPSLEDPPMLGTGDDGEDVVYWPRGFGSSQEDRGCPKDQPTVDEYECSRRPEDPALSSPPSPGGSTVCSVR